MKLTTLGGAMRVTGSSYLIETDKVKFLLDYGMFQGSAEEERLNEELPSFNPGDIDFVILSHAHIDHSGRLPLLVKQGFHGSIYATTATVELSEIMLLDSANIQESDAEWENKRRTRSGNPLIEPLYTQSDARRALAQFKPMHYNASFHITPEIRVRFQDAGHILGSAIVELWITEGEEITKLVFSGDLGMPNKPIIKDPTFINEADYLIMETTYGNKEHEPIDQAFDQLVQIIEETTANNGSVIIPAFSVGRTQELIYQLNEYYERKEISEAQRVPIYIDSPMAQKATQVFAENSMSFDEDAQELIRSGDNPFVFKNLHFTKDVEESKMLNKTRFPRVIISASGMATAGRVRHHLKHHLWDPNSAVVFVGFQAEGTLGRILLEGAKEVKLFGEEIAVKAKIVNVDGFSGHADKDMLNEWYDKFTKKPNEVFLVHGEADQMMPFAEGLRSRDDAIVHTPKPGESFTLATPENPVTEKYDAQQAGVRIGEEYNRILEDMKLLQQNESKLREDLGPQKYQELKDRLLSIQSDLMDINMLIGK